MVASAWGGRMFVVLATACCLTACNRENRALDASPAETGPRAVTVSDLYPGAPAPTPSDPRAQEYEGNAQHIANGQRYYKWFNCSGCHFNGGGGIGPPLMDDKWRYGGSIEQIYASIVQGRPNGMPAFKDKIPEAQVWEIAAYVRSLSGNADKLAAPSRQDGIRAIPPINNMDRAPPTGDPTPSMVGPR
ncbi:c-type cytochrome [Phenylobacterium deserti]|uniref:Cytochrome C n=1 Tax=Phenylobacterium deserti TaxID=1914756 RepID=A0A328AQM1_9CAUL|nr:cytochrome c [Phenylobacterium deserti]RAK56917.1 cytochrome C [Phenylobacterium deserti]